MRERVDLKSPVREYRSPGSVRGAPGNRRPYLDNEKMGLILLELEDAVAREYFRAGRPARVPERR